MNRRQRRIKKTSARLDRLRDTIHALSTDERHNTKRDWSAKHSRLTAHRDRTSAVLWAITPPEPGAIRMSRCDYNGGAPRGYKCNRCSAHGVKLWRDYNTFLNHQELLCAGCLRKHAEASGKTGEVDDHGLWYTGGPHRSDSFFWRVPAVPTADGKTFWGYTSVPPEGVTWWHRLPTRRPIDASA